MSVRVWVCANFYCASMCVCVHPALVRYQMQSDAYLFGPMAEIDLVGAGRGRRRADRTGPDRKYASFGIGPEILPEVQSNADRWSGKPGKTNKPDRKAEAGEAAGTLKAPVPGPALNRYRLSPQLRCQTRFRCGLAKQTQAKLGIVHPALVRYQMQSDAYLFGPMAEIDLVGAGRGRRRADRTGPDRKYASFGIGPEIQKKFELQLDHSRGTGQ